MLLASALQIEPDISNPLSQFDDRFSEILPILYKIRIFRLYVVAGTGMPDNVKIRSFGIITVKTDPFPGSLSTVILP